MGKTLMDGTEQTLFESTEIGEYSGYVFLFEMVAGDRLYIRVYIKNVENNNYYLADSVLFADVQTAPAVRIAHVTGKVGFKVTAQQTIGVKKTVHHSWFRK